MKMKKYEVYFAGGSKIRSFYASSIIAVSYTHLDVYKRQLLPCPGGKLWKPGRSPEHGAKTSPERLSNGDYRVIWGSAHAF